MLSEEIMRGDSSPWEVQRICRWFLEGSSTFLGLHLGQIVAVF